MVQCPRGLGAQKRGCALGSVVRIVGSWGLAVGKTGCLGLMLGSGWARVTMISLGTRDTA